MASQPPRFPALGEARAALVGGRPHRARDRRDGAPGTRPERGADRPRASARARSPRVSDLAERTELEGLLGEDELRSWVERLAAIPDRGSGSSGEREAAELIASELRNSGARVSVEA